MIPLFRKFRFWLGSYPCFLLLLGILNGFSAIYLSGDPLTPGTIFLYATPGLLLSWGLFGLRSSCLRFIPAVILAVISSFFLMIDQTERFQEREMKHQDRLGASAIFRLTDPSLCGGIPEWTTNAPYFIQAELVGYSIGYPEEMISAREKILLTVFRGAADLRRAGYGDLIRAEGYFERIPEPVFSGTFDFPAYAAARGSELVFHAETIKIEKRGDGCFRKIFDWRGHFLTRLTSGMENKTARDMAPALLFGIRQPVRGVIKNDFLHSGTLHILSVSGFHIGLFFVAIMFFLAVFPYRIRWFIAPIPVLLYAISTGMQAPAFRAFVMLTLWSLSHLFLRNNRGMNSLAAAAGIILLLNPYQLFDTGFLYSFLCVFFLILSGDFFGRISRAILVREEFLKDRKRFSLRRIMRNMILSVGVSAAAWLCSLVISMSNQSLFAPWAVPAYLLMFPLTWFCFALFLPAILLQWVPGVTEWIGRLIAPALELCAVIADQFSGSGAYYISPPPLWAGILFLVSLAGVFCLRQKWFFSGSALVLFLSGVFLFIPVSSPDPEIVILRDGALEPAILFCDPVSRRAMIWNIPQGDTSRLISDYLKTHGINTIEEVHFDSARSELCGGARFLFSIYSPKSVYFHGKIRQNAKTASQLRDDFPEPPSLPVMKLHREKNYVEVSPRFAGMNGVSLKKIYSPHKGILLEVNFPEQVFRREYPFSSELIVERITIPERRKAEWRSLLSRGTHPEFPE